MKQPFLLPGIASITAVLVLAGCNDPGFRGVQGVRIAQASEVGSCKLIETVSQEPGVYGPVLGNQGVKYARNKLMDMAGKDGANTIVFTETAKGSEITEVKGLAYSC